MSRPLRVTKIKPEENQPPLEAYVTDLIITPEPITSESVKTSFVTPANAGDSAMLTGVTLNQAKETIQHQKDKDDIQPRTSASVTPANSGDPATITGVTSSQAKLTTDSQKSKEELRQRHRPRSTCEPGEVSAAKKQAKNRRMIPKPRSQSTTDYTARLPAIGKNKKTLQQEAAPIDVHKGDKKTTSSKYQGVTNSLAGVTKGIGIKKTLTVQQDLNGDISGVTTTHVGVTTTK